MEIWAAYVYLHSRPHICKSTLFGFARSLSFCLSPILSHNSFFCFFSIFSFTSAHTLNINYFSFHAEAICQMKKKYKLTLIVSIFKHSIQEHKSVMSWQGFYCVSINIASWLVENDSWHVLTDNWWGKRGRVWEWEFIRIL